MARVGLGAERGPRALGGDWIGRKRELSAFVRAAHAADLGIVCGTREAVAAAAHERRLLASGFETIFAVKSYLVVRRVQSS